MKTIKIYQNEWGCDSQHIGQSDLILGMHIDVVYTFLNNHNYIETCLKLTKQQLNKSYVKCVRPTPGDVRPTPKKCTSDTVKIVLFL